MVRLEGELWETRGIEIKIGWEAVQDKMGLEHAVDEVQESQKNSNWGRERECLLGSDHHPISRKSRPARVRKGSQCLLASEPIKHNATEPVSTPFTTTYDVGHVAPKTTAADVFLSPLKLEG